MPHRQAPIFLGRGVGGQPARVEAELLVIALRPVASSLFCGQESRVPCVDLPPCGWVLLPILKQIVRPDTMRSRYETVRLGIPVKCRDFTSFCKVTHGCLGCRLRLGVSLAPQLLYLSTPSGWGERTALLCRCCAARRLLTEGLRPDLLGRRQLSARRAVCPGGGAGGADTNLPHEEAS